MVSDHAWDFNIFDFKENSSLNKLFPVFCNKLKVAYSLDKILNPGMLHFYTDICFVLKLFD